MSHSWFNLSEACTQIFTYLLTYLLTSFLAKRLLRRWEDLERQQEESPAKKSRYEEPAVVDLEVEDVVAPSADQDADISPHPEQTIEHNEVQLLSGSVDDVIFIINDDIKKDEIKNLFVFLQSRAVWVRYSADITLDWLKDKLLVLYPENYLVTPTFSANNTILQKGMYNKYSKLILTLDFDA